MADATSPINGRSAPRAARIAGRRAAAELAGRNPDVAGGRFAGCSLDAIRRAVARLFSIGVMAQCRLRQIAPRYGVMWVNHG